MKEGVAVMARLNPVSVVVGVLIGVFVVPRLRKAIR